jgi:hypothetical protein
VLLPARLTADCEPQPSHPAGLPPSRLGSAAATHANCAPRIHPPLPFAEVPLPAELAGEVDAKRSELIEAVAEVDEGLAERFLLEEPIDGDALRDAVRRCACGRGRLWRQWMGPALRNARGWGFQAAGIRPLHRNACAFSPTSPLLTPPPPPSPTPNTHSTRPAIHPPPPPHPPAHHPSHRSVLALKFVPVFMGSAFKNRGVQLLLDGVTGEPAAFLRRQGRLGAAACCMHRSREAALELRLPCVCVTRVFRACWGCAALDLRCLRLWPPFALPSPNQILSFDPCLQTTCPPRLMWTTLRWTWSGGRRRFCCPAPGGRQLSFGSQLSTDMSAAI